MKLGIDIDGTITQTHKAAIKIYNEELDLNVKEDEVTTYFLDEPFGLTAKEGKKMWRKMEAKIYKIGIPLEHSSEMLSSLAEKGHEIFYITARPGFKNIRKITLEWLKNHQFPLEESNLIMSAQNKGKIAKEIGIDIFFEDDPKHIENIVEMGISTVIVDCSYNKECSEEIPRIKNWLEGKKYVDEYKKDIRN